jgi:MFS transporter, OFA family, oxalate/formate antiporter
LKAVATLIGAFCTHLTIGSQYAWGSIAPYIVGYFRDMGIETNMSQFYMVLPLIVIMSTFFFPIGTRLTPIIGSKAVILIGGLCCVVFTAFSTLSRHVVAFFVLYAVGFGIGKGFLYPAPLNAGWSHLPARKGFVSGIVVSGLGIGAFIFAMLTKYVMNPDNIAPQPYQVAPGVVEYIFPPEVN